MDFPLEIGFSGHKISAHLIFEDLGFVLGFRYYLYLRKRERDIISGPNRIWIIIGATFGAFFFSRLVGSLEAPYLWKGAKNHLLYFFANKTIVGGLLGGLLGVEFTKYIIGEKNSSGDLFTSPIILAMIIGRIGCFSSGVYEQTYGVATGLPWGMDLGDGVLRHPVVIYEIVFLAVLWWSLWGTKNKYLFHSGVIFQFFMISYLLFRLAIEWIKPSFRFGIGLTTIQITCILGLSYFSKTIFLLLTKPKKLLVNEQHT